MPATNKDTAALIPELPPTEALKLGEVHILAEHAPAPLRGLRIKIVRRVLRHGYVTGRVLKGTRERPKGTDLHLLAKWVRG